MELALLEELPSGLRTKVKSSIPKLQLAELRDAVTEFFSSETRTYHSFIRFCASAVAELTSESYPQLLRPAAENHLLDFLQTFYPFFFEPIWSIQVASDRLDAVPTQGHIYDKLSEIVYFFLGPLHLQILGGGLNWDGALRERHEAGLLREEQVQLWKVVLKHYVLFGLEVKAACELDESFSIGNLDSTTSSLLMVMESRMDAFSNAICNQYYPSPYLLGQFVYGSRAIRSERLEILLLRYINDGEPANQEVVKGLEYADKLFGLAEKCRHEQKLERENWTRRSCCHAKEEFGRNSWNDLGPRNPDGMESFKLWRR